MPLTVPDYFKIYKIIAIDPGLNNLGVAIFEIDYYNRTILKIEAFTLVNDKLPDDTGLDEDLYRERTIKLYKLRNSIRNIIININPCLVCCEAPFYSSFRPTAYAALLEVINSIHSTIIEYNPNISFLLIEPLLVKKSVGAKLNNDKNEVKQALINKPDIGINIVGGIELLDEHSIDAIAIGYTYITNLN